MESISSIIENVIGEEYDFQDTYDCNCTEWKLPMAKTVISEYLDPKKDEKYLLQFLKQYLNDYSFVKMCYMSPKDIKDPPVFDSVREAYNAIINSERTDRPGHLILKVKKEYITQTRVFVCRDKIRTICGTMDMEKVLKFMRIHKFDFPLSDYVAEIGEENNGDIEVIELNTFSTLCDPSPLAWEQDWEQLIFGENPLYIDFKGLSFEKIFIKL